MAGNECGWKERFFARLWRLMVEGVVKATGLSREGMRNTHRGSGWKPSARAGL